MTYGEVLATAIIDAAGPLAPALAAFAFQAAASAAGVGVLLLVIGLLGRGR